MAGNVRFADEWNITRILIVASVCAFCVLVLCIAVVLFVYSVDNLKARMGQKLDASRAVGEDMCSHGRVYVNIKDNDFKHYSGVFVQQPAVLHNRPSFQLEGSRSIYLYYVDDSWLITDQLDKPPVMRMRSSSMRPNTVGTWQVVTKEGARLIQNLLYDDKWRNASSVKITCVGSTFRKCFSTKIRVSGIGNEKLAALFNGDYLWSLSLLHDDHTVWRHVRNEAYIHYSIEIDGWLIHSTLSSNFSKSETILVNDYASRIEYVMNDWMAWDEKEDKWKPTSMTIECIYEKYYDEADCAYGRVFFGNTKYKALHKYTGIFIQQPGSVEERPFYKHETRNVHLYYSPANYWVVQEAGADILMRMRSDKMTPMAETGERKYPWFVRVDQLWFKELKLRAICVDDTFITCHSGTISVSGIHSSSNIVSEFNGQYNLLPGKRHGNHQVYQHQTNGAYFFYNEQAAHWRIRQTLSDKRDSDTLFSNNPAARPEYILGRWVAGVYLNNELGVESVVNVKVVCIKLPGQPRKVADKCDNGRVFLGGLPFADFDNVTGIFIQQPGAKHEYPFYKHEFQDVYLYHSPTGYWVVEEAGAVINIRLHSDAIKPTAAPQVWYLRIDGKWDEFSLEAKCVDYNFVTCRTGRLRVSGFKSPSKFNGDYVLAGRPKLFHGRQVYTHETNNANLFYNNKYRIWRMQTLVIENMHEVGATAADSASRPEYITKSWLSYRPILPLNLTIECVEGIGMSMKDDIMCEHGRVYFGTVDEARYLNIVGIYEEQPRLMHGRVKYKHENGNAYLHYTASSYWVVEDASAVVVARTLTDTEKPSVSGFWEVQDTTSKKWRTLTNLRAVCVNDNFATCRTGKIRVSGINRTLSVQAKLNGEYSLTDTLFNGRQVYKHDKVDAYLFYGLYKLWVLQGNVSNKVEVRAPFSYDLASRPEYIVNEWKLWSSAKNGSRNQRVNLHINCVQVQVDVSPDDVCNEIFVGSVNDAYADHIPHTGVFIRELHSTQNYIRYQKTLTQLYLYYNARRKRWVVGTENRPPFLMADKQTNLPQLNTTWSARVGRRWVRMHRLVAVCVNTKFVACRTGTLVVTGVRKRSGKPSEMNGTYVLTNQVLNNRPVYWRRSGTKEFRFLHYRTDGGYGRWVISYGTQTPVLYGTMYSEDYAWRPEFIIHPWHAIPGYEYAVKSVMPKAQCIKSPHPSILDFQTQEPEYVLDACCVVPFTYKGRTYTACTKVEATYYWCSCTASFIGRWQYCKPKMVPNPICTIPFEHEGLMYDRCVEGKFGLYWCPHSAQGAEHGWSYCNPPTIKPDPDCHFPFLYNGFEFHACTPFRTKHGLPWCATKRQFSGDDWEFCVNLAVKPHRLCKLPFLYRGKLYYHCVAFGSSFYWCSLHHVLYKFTKSNWKKCMPI